MAGVTRGLMLPITYPLHVITLRYRENVKPELRLQDSRVKIQPHTPQSLSQVISTIYNQKAWYNGGLSYTCRVVPQAASLFFIYEMFRKINLQ